MTDLVSDTTDRSEQAQLGSVARLLGELVLYEIDREQAVRLGQPELSGLLAGLGLELPAGLAEDDAARDELAADYSRAMLLPEDGTGPLVQSLHEEGSYEGRAVAAVRRFAKALGFEFDRESARHVPPDHLGCELLLWANLLDRDPELSDRFAAEHLVWALEPLKRRAADAGFYGSLAEVTRRFLEVLTQD